MTTRSNSNTGYSKKELMAIIKKIDTDNHQEQIRTQNKKANENRGDRDSFINSGFNNY